MNRLSTFFYISIILILLLPSTFGKFIFDLAGGLFILILGVPFLLAGIVFISWKIIQSKSKHCNSCGTTFFSDKLECPICGSKDLRNESKSIGNNLDIAASDATIDITINESNE